MYVTACSHWQRFSPVWTWYSTSTEAVGKVFLYEIGQTRMSSSALSTVKSKCQTTDDPERPRSESSYLGKGVFLEAASFAVEDVSVCARAQRTGRPATERALQSVQLIKTHTWCDLRVPIKLGMTLQHAARTT